MAAFAAQFFVMTTPSTLIHDVANIFAHNMSAVSQGLQTPAFPNHKLQQESSLMYSSLWQSLKKHWEDVPTLLLGMMASIMPWLSTSQIPPWHFFSIFIIESGLGETFPALWRVAIVLPLPKPGKDALVWLNYKPIALTSCLCKLQEKMVNGWLSGSSSMTSSCIQISMASAKDEAARCLCLYWSSY